MERGLGLFTHREHTTHKDKRAHKEHIHDICYSNTTNTRFTKDMVRMVKIDYKF